MKRKRLLLTTSVGMGVMAVLILLGLLSSPSTAVTAGPAPSIPNAAAGAAALSRSDVTPLHYVAITGTDSGDCSMPVSACLTIQYAVDQANEGD